MASFDFGIKISAQDSASAVLSGIQQKMSGFGSGVAASMAGATDRLAKFGMATQGVQQITGALSTVSDAFTAYESDLAAVGAITGLAGSELNNIGSAARNLAKDFGGSASDQLKSFQGVLSKFGADQFKTAEGAKSLELISRNINTLSAASGDSAAQSMDVLANAMLQMGINTDDAGIAARTSTEYMNVLAASAQVGSAEIPQVGAAFLQVGTAAKGLNMGFTEVNTAIQVLGKGGKYGAEAGVALRNVMGLMMSASKPAEAALASLGTSSAELGKMLTDPSKGLNEGMKKLKVGLQKLPDDYSRANALAQIFGAENKAAAEVLLNNTDTYDNYRKAIGESASAGAAQTQASVRMATAGAFAARAQAYVNDAFLTAGSAIGKYGVAAISTVNSIAPQITALAGIKSLIPETAFSSIKTGISSAFSGASSFAGNALAAVQGKVSGFSATLRQFSFGNVFSSLRTGAVSAVSSMGGALSGGVSALRNFAAQQMLAARGSALFSNGIGGFASSIGGSLMTGLRSAVTGIMGMNMAFLTSPVTWIALAIAAAAFVIYKNWSGISAYFSGLFSGIQGFFTGFMDGISAAFAAPWGILQEVGAAFRPIIDAVSSLFTPVSGVAGATGAAASNFAWLKDAGIVAGQYIGTAFRVVLTPILWVVKVIAQVIGMMTGLTTSGGNMARVLVGAFTAITLPIQLVMNLVGGLFTFIQSLFSGASLQEAGMNMITSLWSGIQAMWCKLVDGVKGLVGGITNLFSGKKEEAKTATAALQKVSAEPEKKLPEAKKTIADEIAKKEIKAPKVGKPKIPSPDAPKLKPLNPPEAPDFSWIAKQNAEPPKIKPFAPIAPPKIAEATGGVKPLETGLPQMLKSISTEGTKLFSENSTAFQIPEIQLPKITGIEGFTLPQMGDKGKLPPNDAPRFTLPSELGQLDVLKNLKLPELGSMKLPELGNMKFPQLEALLKGIGVDAPSMPKFAPMPFSEQEQSPVTGKSVTIPAPQFQAQRGGNGGVTVHFSVGDIIINGTAQASGNPRDTANHIKDALRDFAPEIARAVQEELEKGRRLEFSSF
ncbi:MAG: phage tail tape measure protein [Candidatus Kapaibacteriota bacterium]